MNEEQKEIVKEIKTLVSKLEASIENEEVSKSADGDWVNAQTKERPKRG